MAGALGVSPSTIQRYRKSSPGYEPDEDGTIAVTPVVGLDGKVRPSRRLDTDVRDNAIVELHRRGDSMRTIARKVGCSVGTVHRILTNHLG